MHEMRLQLEETIQAIRDVQQHEDPAVQHLAASAANLVELLGRIVRERVWN